MVVHARFKNHKVFHKKKDEGNSNSKIWEWGENRQFNMVKNEGKGRELGDLERGLPPIILIQ
jgi:hypothetical protein